MSRMGGQCCAEWEYEGATYYCVRPTQHVGEHQVYFYWPSDPPAAAPTPTDTA